MKVGITTTIPVEILLAADTEPVDLNNIFITDPEAAGLVGRAETDGFPRTACAWIKGIYAATLKHQIPVVVAVTQGDCAQTHAMIETLTEHGVRIIPFAYPYDRDAELLRAQIQRLADHFGVTWDEAEGQRQRLRSVRRKVAEIDRLTWREGLVNGWENHYYQVCCSDFNGDPGRFEAEIDEFLERAGQRTPDEATVRIGVAGVPTIFSDLYEFIEGLDARVVLNEMQRQFTMADCLDCELLEQYRRYTYPYQLAGRLDDLRRQIELRRIDGLIHYTQAFCFRQIQDLLIKRHLDLPVLSLEGENPGPLDARTRLRVEAFIETLQARARR
ncbi:MAG: 2-hydroxyacyl-CoA dehydratase [Armatimonadota bacterium]|nr:2-hydroxyacyl-CoA dehydratase [Armatimonadota bacterium]